MSSGEFIGNGQYRVGYVKPAGQPWQPVLCSVVKPQGKDKEYLIFQGCIILGTVEEMEEVAKKIRDNPALLTDPNAQLLGVIIRGAQFRWPNDKPIPYEIDPGLPQKDRVEKAIKHWEDNTTFRFKKREPADNDFIAFVPVDSGCASNVGRQGGRQEIWLGSGCSTGNVIHEIGHAIGFWHEQSRADRDQHIEIVWANVDPRYRHNFEQHIHDGIDIGFYDYESIMHYPAKAFSLTGQDTIKPKVPGAQIGQRTKLSDGDKATAEKINTLAAG